jgi:hypothetical protein
MRASTSSLDRTSKKGVDGRDEPGHDKTWFVAMTSTVVAISLGYAALGVLLLALGLEARLAWWIKAAAIVVTSAFFVVVFFATNGLLGWPARGPLPARFQLLWTRVVEPDARSGEAGAVYLWVEETDENNVPGGTPKSYRLPYSRTLADRSLAARDEIVAGHPQQGLAGDLAGQDATAAGEQTATDTSQAESRPVQAPVTAETRAEPGVARIDMNAQLAQAEPVRFRAMPPPTLPPKVP